MFNHSDVEFNVAKGDRIAQLICERIFYPTLEECPSLTDTQRGAGKLFARFILFDLIS